MGYVYIVGYVALQLKAYFLLLLYVLMKVYISLETVNYTSTIMDSTFIVGSLAFLR